MKQAERRAEIQLVRDRVASLVQKAALAKTRYEHGDPGGGASYLETLEALASHAIEDCAGLLKLDWSEPEPSTIQSTDPDIDAAVHTARQAFGAAEVVEVQVIARCDRVVITAALDRPRSADAG